MYSVVELDDFARRFSMRSGGLMWLLGAGASASAGIPTAWNMIWEFKQKLYVSRRRIGPQQVADLSNSAVRQKIQEFITSEGDFPEMDSPEEYAALFEAVFPSESDRRAFIDAKISGAKPSYGHIALATLMQAGHTRLVWSTNFDPLVADACARVFGGTGALTTVALDSPELAQQVLQSERWPVEIKLHGDFRSRRLKNTGDELRNQDAILRDLLVKSCRDYGLVVAGYSGRDSSIMTALEEVLTNEKPYPGGLFWLHCGENSPPERVSDFLASAAKKEIDGGLVRIQNFDETLRDLIRLIQGINTDVLDDFSSKRAIVSPVPRITGKEGYPVIRLNALSVEKLPTICRRVECRVGGVKEVAEMIAQAGVDVLATRSKKGVLAFGEDSDIRDAFSKLPIEEFDLYEIKSHRLRYDSQERSLLRQALSKALAQKHRLNLERRRNSDLLSPIQPSDATWQPLVKILGKLSGTVPRHPELVWKEGISTRFDWADDRLWLLFEPRTLMSGIEESNRSAAAEFIRERSVKRYNRQLNDLVAFWGDLLAADGASLNAMNITVGVDAVFKLGSVTAFSKRSCI